MRANADELAAFLDTTWTLAEGVSGRVRALDTEQRHVTAALGNLSALRHYQLSFREARVAIAEADWAGACPLVAACLRVPAEVRAAWPTAAALPELRVRGTATDVPATLHGCRDTLVRELLARFDRAIRRPPAPDAVDAPHPDAHRLLELLALLGEDGRAVDGVTALLLREVDAVEAEGGGGGQHTTSGTLYAR